MPNSELETIAASMTEAIHRAYSLGRTDALRRVVEMVQQDDLGSRAVALIGRTEPAQADRHDEPPAADTVSIHKDQGHEPKHSDHGHSDHGHAERGHTDRDQETAAATTPASTARESEEPVAWWRRKM